MQLFESVSYHLKKKKQPIPIYIVLTLALVMLIFTDISVGC